MLETAITSAVQTVVKTVDLGIRRGQCPASLINISGAESISCERMVEAAGVALEDRAHSAKVE